MKIWRDYIILDQYGDVEFINNGAKDLLGLERKDPLVSTFRQLLLRYSFSPVTLHVKKLSEEVAIFTGDLCAFIGTECLQVRKVDALAGEILVLKSQMQYYQDEPRLHSVISANVHVPVSSANLAVERLIVRSDQGENEIFKEPTRLNSAGMMCFRRIVVGLMKIRPIEGLNQMLIWPTAPKTLVDWTLNAMGWVSSSAVTTLPSSFSFETEGQYTPKSNEWTLLHLCFSITPIDQIEQITFSELTNYERLWLIPATTGA